MRRLALIVCSCPILLCLTLPVGAGESWPAFRGPTADGHAAGSRPPVEWDAATNVLWETEIPGSGWSTPVVADGLIMLTAAVPSEDGESGDLSLRLIVVDEGTGNIVRNVEVFRQDGADAPQIHNKNSHASPTPVIEADRVYVHFGHQGTACLSRSGQLIWQTRDFRYAPVHGNGGSPIVVDDLLIFSCDGSDVSFVVGLDKQTGRQRWRTPRQTDASRTFSFSTPALVEVDGRKQLISPGSNTVDSLDPQSGRLLWRVRYDGYSVIPQPVFGQGLLFVSSGYDRPSVLAIRPTGRGDVTDTHVAWQSDRHAPHTPSMLLAGDELYMVSDRGVATCRDARSGEIHWQQRLPGGYSASPILASGHIYFLNEEGQATVVEATTSYREVATNRVGQRTLASMAVVGDRLYLRGDRTLFCFAGH